MEEVIALAIGVLGASGVWLMLRPRTFQVIMGISLMSYAVNLFIFSMGSLAMDREPIIAPGVPTDLSHYTDPLPQALVLTAIVIGFAMTALFLVVLMASRGLTGTDHVDGVEDPLSVGVPALADEALAMRAQSRGEAERRMADHGPITGTERRGAGGGQS